MKNKRKYGFYTSSVDSSSFEDVRVASVSVQIKRLLMVQRWCDTDCANLQSLGLANPHIIESLEKISAEIVSLLER